MKNSDIDELFTHYPPRTQADEYKHQLVRVTLRLATRDIAEELPYSRERSMFISAMQQAAMWASAALALNRDKPPAKDGKAAISP